jgi:hypothetical protein
MSKNTKDKKPQNINIPNCDKEFRKLVKNITK